jgi:hypothetical protein
MSKHIPLNGIVFIGSISLFLAAILLLAGFLLLPASATPQQLAEATTTTAPPQCPPGFTFNPETDLCEGTATTTTTTTSSSPDTTPPDLSGPDPRTPYS